MTVKVDDRRKEYDGNGIATVFNGPMAYSASHIQAWLVDIATNVATQVPGSAFDVDRIGRQNGTRVTMGTAPPTGQKLLLLRVVPIAQTVDVTNQGDFNASVLETMGDLLEMQIQQVLDGQNHKIGVPETSLANISTTMPLPVPDVLWGWGPAPLPGDPLLPKYYTLSELANFIAYGDKTVLVRAGTGAQTVYPLGRDPGSIGNLDVSIDGVTQVNGLDFTYSGTDLTFTTAPPDQSVVLIRFDQAVPVGTGLASAIFYTPPSTLIPGSVQSFLDSLWTAASNAGGALIRFLAAGAGAIGRTLQDKARDEVSTFDFMTPAQIADVRAGTALIDVTASVQAAIDALPVAGGRLKAPAGRHLLSSPLTIANKTIVLEGDGMDVSIFEWVGAGMTGQNGINFSHTQQVPFHVKNLSLVAAPVPGTPATLAGKAISITYPVQTTVFAPTVRMEKVYIRPRFTGDSWNPTRVGGWAEAVHASDASNANFVDCEFVCNTNANVTYGLHITSSTNTVYLVLDGCNFGGHFKSVYSDGSQSIGGLVATGCNWVGVNIGIDVSVASDMVQVDSCYMQAYTWGVRSLARTTLINNSRFDMDPDPFGRYAPAEADAIVLGNTFVTLDGSVISNNHFGGSAVIKNALRATQGVQHSLFRDNTVGDVALFGTAYTRGFLLETGSNNNTVTGNHKVAVTTLCLDNGSNNYVYGNVPTEGYMGVTGATPTLKSGAGNVTLDSIVGISQAGATNVTNILNGWAGQRITFIGNDANSTFVHGANIRLNGLVNYNLPGNGTLSFVFDGALWRETSRSTG